MGAFMSCCCGRRHKSREEKEPLLPRHAQEVQQPHRQEQIQKIAGILAALSARKYPSQKQLNVFIQNLQRNVLDVRSSMDSYDGHYGPLGARGRTVLNDLREACHAILQFGLEKNYDDVVQEFWYHCSQVEPIKTLPNPELRDYADNAQSEFSRKAPTLSADEVNTDIGDAALAIRTLASLIVTSSAFRLILIDILLTAREVMADMAVTVSSVAGIVQDEAAELDEIIRPPPETRYLEGVDMFGIEAVKSKGRELKQIAEDIPEQIATGTNGKADVVPESTQRIRAAVVDRIKAIVLKAQSDRACESALVTIFDLLHKYVKRAAELSSAAKDAMEKAPEPPRDSRVGVMPLTIEVDSELVQTMALIRKFLNRFATGVDGILRSWRNLVDHVYANPGELDGYLFSISSWLRRAMETPQWVNSEQASTELSQLYDRGQAMLDLDPDLHNILGELLDQAEGFTNAVKEDKSTNRLAEAFAQLNQHTKDLGFTGLRVAAGQKDALREARQEIWHDALAWLLPRVLRIIKAIPMPRLEYTSLMVDAVIDDVVLNAPSFVPDHIFINNTNTVHVLSSAGLDKAIAIEENPGHRRHRQSVLDSRVSVASTTRLRISGLRISAKFISYFANVRYGILRWTDNGLLGFDLGTQVDPQLKGSRSEGLSLDIELKTAQPNTGSFFDVQDVSIDMPGLVFRISKSRHWLINSLLGPIIGPLGRWIGGSIAASQVKMLLKAVDKLAFDVHERAIQNTRLAHSHTSQPGEGTDEVTPSIGAYWFAFLEAQAASYAREQAAAAGASQNGPTTTESKIHATVRGIIQTTRVEGPSGQVEEESAMAAGIGPQLLPGRGGPDITEEGRGVDAAVEEVNEILDEVQGVVETTQERVLGSMAELQESARTTKEELERGTEAYEQRKYKERERDGWRSGAFDL